MARLTRLRTMLDVRSMDETVRFYEALGFEVVGSMGEGDEPSWRQVRRDDVWLMFNWAPPHDHGDGDLHAHDPALSGAIYIDVDDVDALFASVRDKVSVVHEPTDRPHGMRELAVEDPNGYLLLFGTPTG